MHTSTRLTRSALRQCPRPLVYVSALMLAAAALLAGRAADASIDSCNGSSCTDVAARSAVSSQQHTTRLVDALALADLANTDSRRAGLSDQEYFSFSGVGAIVCTVNGAQRTATAFLVGAFDLGVTVAHTFVDHGKWTTPESCVYTTTDSLGQIRERIPVASIQSQWEANDGSFGQLAKDLAVIRLATPSRFAQRTMPLGKFSGSGANVVMVGFKTNMESDTTKLKTRGTVYARKANGIAISDLAGFMHDMNAGDLAAGAPVIDEHSGVIIGIHTTGLARPSRPARNTMIVMNEWLETTLHNELQSQRAAKAN